MTREERANGTTPFQTIYDAFYNIVTDDMYLEWTREKGVMIHGDHVHEGIQSFPW